MAAQPVDEANSLHVHSLGQQRITIAGGRANDARQWYYDIGRFQKPPNQLLIPCVAHLEVEAGIGAKMKQARLPVHQIVKRNDLISGIQQVLTRDGTRIPGRPGHQHPGGHSISRSLSLFSSL